MARNNKLDTAVNRLSSSTALLAALMFSAPALAEGVVEGEFVSGSGSFSHSANKTTITVHDRNTIANFKDYNIGANQQVHYQHNLGSGSAANLSRVTGGNESQILGRLTSDKVDVFLVNPNGIFFGKNAVVDVPKFVATTSDITNANFKAGNYNFGIKGNPNAKIVNHGSITVADTGLAALVAPGVENHGVIVANQGTVTLAAGEQFTLDVYGDNLINFAVSAEDNERYVKQSGDIIAKDGYVVLTAQDTNDVVNSVINMDGVIEANAVSIQGDEIILGSTSQINASSANGGGKISIKGKNIDVKQGVTITADATVDGNGGEIIIYGSDELHFAGSASAKGAGNGDGGFIETSAIDLYLSDSSNFNTSAPNGKYGTWFIDPRNYKVHTGSTGLNQINNVFLSNLLGSNNITLATGLLGFQPGDFTIEANITKTSGGDTVFTAFGWRDVILLPGITISSTSNALGVRLAALRNVEVNGTINTNGGDFMVSGGFVPFTNPGIPLGSAQKFVNTGTINTGAGDVMIDANIIDIDNTITGNNVHLVADNRVELDAEITATNLTGDTDRVDVISDNGIINQGIEIVNTNGTVNLGADTFDQTVFVNKDIDLVGSGVGSTIIAPTSAPSQEFQNYFNNIWNRAIVLVQNADANISNLTIDGSTAGNLAAAPAQRRLVGIGLDNAGGVIDGVKITDIADNKLGRGEGITAQVDTSEGDAARNITVQNSEITDYQFEGVSFDGNLITADINNNIITGISGAASLNQAGVLLHRGAIGSVDNNTISGNTFAGSRDIYVSESNGTTITNNTLTGAGVNAVQVLDSDAVVVTGNNIQNHAVGILNEDSTNTEIANNTLANNTTGIAIVDPITSSATIHDQTITGGTTGLQVTGADAEVTFGANVVFDGQSGQYISLENTAMGGQNLDATTVIFDGVNGATATDAELVAIEDKIRHRMDDDNVGRAWVKANTQTATVNNLGIQQGVDISNSGGTVLVGGGIYDETVKITKDLTLREAEGTGDAIIAPTTTPDADQEFTKSTDSTKTRAIVLVQDANVNILDLTIDGSAGAGTGVAAGTRLAGIGFDNAGGAVRRTTVANMSDDALGWSVGIHADSDTNHGDAARNLVIRNNDIEDFQSIGVLVGGDQLTVDVRGNDIDSDQSKSDQRGIWAEYGVSGQIRNNIITDITTSSSKGIVVTRNTDGLSVAGNTISVGGASTTGIQVSGGSDNTIITGNTVENQNVGIEIDNSLNAAISDNTLTNNTTQVYIHNPITASATIEDQTFTGGTTGVRVSGANASVEFVGPNVAFNGQTGQYISLENGAMDDLHVDAKAVSFDGKTGATATDAELVAIEDKIHHELDDTGVGLVWVKDGVLVATVNNLGIQQAVDSSSSGGTVLVGGGMYDESVIIDKDLTLDGVETTGEVIIKPLSQTSMDNSFRSTYWEGEKNKTIILAQNANVDISDLTVDGSFVQTGFANTIFPWGTYERAVGIGYDNASGNIDNVEVRHIGDDARQNSVGIFADSNSNRVGFIYSIPTGDAANTVDVTNSNILDYQATGINMNGDMLRSDVSFNTIDGNGPTADPAFGFGPKHGVEFSRGTAGNIFFNSIEGNTGIAGADIYLNSAASGTGFDLTTGVNVFGHILSDVQPLGAGVKVDNTDGARIGLNAFIGKGNGIRVTDSDDVLTGFNAFFGNDTGIYADNSENLTVAYSLFGLNGTGVSANNSSTDLNVMDSIFFNNGEGIHASSSSDFATISDSQFIDNDTGVHLDGADDSLIRDSYFEGNTDGIFAEDDADRNTVRRSTFFNNGDGIEGNDADDLLVVNSTFDNNFRGIYLRNDSDDAIVRGSDTLFTNNDYGIYADDSARLLVRDAEFRRNGDGVHLETGADDATIRDSIFRNNGNGIHVDGADNATVINSQFRRNDNGIFADDNSDFLTVRDSLFRNNDFGIQGDETDDLTVVNSTFRDNDVAGVYLRDDSDRATIRDSFFFDNPIGIHAIETSSGLTVNNTELHDNGTAIKIENSDDATVRFSNIFDNTIVGIDANNSENLTVVDTDFTNNPIGIDLDTNSDNATVRDSRFTSNGTGINAAGADLLAVNNTVFSFNTDGIRAKNSDDNRIIGSTFSDNTNNGIFGEDVDRMVVSGSSSFTRNNIGINLTNDSEENTVRDSSFDDNSTGVRAIGGSNDLLVDNSSFTSNGTGIDLINSHDTIVRNNSRFIGNGTGIDTDNSQRLLTRDSLFRGNKVGIFLDTDSDNATVNNTRFIENGYGIYAMGADNLTVNNGSAFRRNDIGIRLMNSDDNRIIDTVFTDDDRTQIGIFGDDVDRMIVRDSTFRGNDIGANLTDDSEENTFNNTRFVDNNIGLQAIGGSNDLTVNNGSVFRDNETGIRLEDSRDARVVDSRFLNNVESGIYAMNSDNLVVNNSRFRGNEYGIMLEDSDNARVVGDSRFIDNGFGIWARRSDNLTVRDGLFNGNRRGIRLAISDDARIIDSEFNDNNRGIVIRNGSDNTLIRDTQINGGNIGLFVDGRSGGVEGPISLTIQDVTFGGNMNSAAIHFQNATLVGGVDVSGVQLLSTAPVGWRFENVTGEAPSDVFNPGDLDFNDTVFGDNFSLADIQLVNSTMDGFAENVTFIGDGGDPFIRELRVIHDFDDPALGTIFYDGYDIVSAFFDFIFADQVNRTDLDGVFFREISTAGQVFSTPGLNNAPVPKQFNVTNNTKVSLNATGGTQVANASPEALNNLATASGNDPESFNNLAPNSGNNYQTTSCSVNFANDFLGEDVLLANANGTCQ